MNHDIEPKTNGNRHGLSKPGGTTFNIMLALMLGIAGYFLWTEHRAHLGSILVWGLLLACPLMHFFMHGSHGGHQNHHPDASAAPDHSGHTGSSSKEQ